MSISLGADETGAQHRLDGDAALGARRLERFVGAMLPIALAFLGFYVVAAVIWRSVALAGGAGAVAIYVVALLVARVELARHAVARAAAITGIALLVMIAIGAVFLKFELAALPLIAIAAVVVVLPHLGRRALIQFAALTLAVIAEIVVIDGMLPPLVEQPPIWFQNIVIAAAVLAASTLIIIMLAADHERMRALVTASELSAAEANRARDATETFLVAAAHQLRTPVSTVLLQTETILRSGQGDAATRARLERLVRQALKLQRVVDAMLDVSRASAGTLQLESGDIDLAAIVRAVAIEYGAAAADAGVVIEIQAPDTLSMRGDAARLALVASHLLDNAIKFGAGTPAQLVLREEPTAVVLSVKDGGPGMTEVDRQQCFDRYVRLSSRADGSLGIGLWLVRKLSDAMGGEVTAQGGPNAGTTFTIRIPRVPA